MIGDTIQNVPEDADIEYNTWATTRLDIFTTAFGSLAIISALIGFFGNVTGIQVFSGVCDGCKTPSLTAILVWMFMGVVCILVSYRKVSPRLSVVLRALFLIIGAVETIELVYFAFGHTFIIETWSVIVGSWIFKSPSTVISQIASFLIVITSAAFIISLDPAFRQNSRRIYFHLIAAAGIVTCLTGFTFVLSYVIGKPLSLTPTIIPISAYSALAAMFVGLGLIGIAGPKTYTVGLFWGTSARARLLRTFVPLTVAITLGEVLVISVVASWVSIANALLIAISLVVFIILTGIVAGKVAAELGYALERSEDALTRRNAELNAANRELRGVSQYLRNLFQYASAPIIVWETDYRIRQFNHAAEILTGRTAESVIGKPLETILPEESREKTMELIRKASAGERWDAVEIPVCHISGATKIVLWNSAHIFSDDGRTIISTIALGQDITDRKEAEGQVELTASLLKAALESTTDGIIVANLKRKITMFNHQFSTMWGIPEDKIEGALGSVVLSYMLPLLVDREGFIDRRTDLDDHPYRESYDMVKLLDGRIFERFSKPQMIGDTVVGRVWSFRDVTERIQTEEALRETLERIRIITSNTPDHILIQDKDLRYTLVINPQLGLTEEEMLGKTDYDLISKDEAETLTALKRTVLETGNPIHAEFPLTALDGEKIYFAGSYVPKRNAEGDIDGLIGYFQNITSIKLANEKMAETLAEKEILIREIHHRVKNNLQIISALIEMTRTRATDDEIIGVLTDLMLKIKTLANIHNRLYLSDQFDRVNMKIQIQDIVTDLQLIYSKGGKDIICLVDANEFILSVDKAIPCALALNEIISNSFRHAFTGMKKGTVNVRAELIDREQVRISVEDNGTGIPREVDPEHSPSLGLKLVRNLVGQLHGSMVIANTEHGARVTVEFPLETEE